MNDERRRIGGQVLTAALGGAAWLGGTDALAVLAHREVFFTWSDALRAAGAAAGVAGTAGAAIGAGIALLWFWATTRRAATTAAVAAALGALATVLIWILTSGRKAQHLPGRTAWVIASGALTAAAVFAAARWWKRWTQDRSGRLTVCAAAIAAAVGASAADALILPRLYPPFHMALSALAAAASALAAGLFALRGRRAAIAAIISLAAVGAGGIWGYVHISRAQTALLAVSEYTLHATDAAAVLVRAAAVDQQWTDAGARRLRAAHSGVADISLPERSVFFVTIDAMRADRLHRTYGSKGAVTPNLNALASRAITFARAYTPVPQTSYALMSLLTGKYLYPLMHDAELEGDHETLPDIFKRFGYRTGGFFTKAVFFVDRPKFIALERRGAGFGYLKMEYSFTAWQKTDQVLEFLNKVQAIGSPVFAWVHYFEAHEPYDSRCTRFGSENVQRYDCELFTADAQLGRLLEVIDARYPDAVVVVTADHGEEFRDHGGTHHGTTLYEEQIHVPLVIKVPGLAPRTVSTPVNLVDVAGTVLQMVDIPLPPKMRSTDLTALMTGADDAFPPVFSELRDELAVVDGKWKAIWNRKTGLVRLFDLERDPRERRSLTAQHSRTAGRLQGLMAAWTQTHVPHELRPVRTQDAYRAWPAAIASALQGKPVTVADLLAVAASSDQPAAFTEVAARLVYERASEKDAVPVPTTGSPITRCWLTLAAARTGAPVSRDHLEQAGRDVPPEHACAGLLLQARLQRGDATAAPRALAFAAMEQAEVPVRQQVVRALGNPAYRRFGKDVAALIDNYRLRIPAAQALAAMGFPDARRVIARAIDMEPIPKRKRRLQRLLEQMGDSTND